jgi:transcriptional regulator with XRE-family HTH domain
MPSDIERGINGIDAQDLARIAEITDRPLEFFTNPRFRDTPVHRPRSKAEWLAMYPDSPETAAMHFEVDQLTRKARRSNPPA